jgi:hypothetical protein
MAQPPKGRLVWNHSTHIPGLIPVLVRLTEIAGIHTITPAVIGPARSKHPSLQLKVSIPIRGGFKVIARKGKTVQEVFIVTSLSKEELQGAIGQIMDR